MKTLTEQMLGLYIGQNIVYGDEPENKNYRLSAFLFRRKADFKLLLRPLSSATDEEVVECCKLADSLPFMSPNRKRWEVKRIEVDHYFEVKSATSDYSFSVDWKTGNVDVYRLGDVEVPCGSLASVVLYQTSKGFDLFDLIPSGVALDSTTLK